MNGFQILPFDTAPNLSVLLMATVSDLRPSDWDEVRGIIGDVTPRQLYESIMSIPGYRWVAANKSLTTVYGVGGFHALRSGVLEGWILGTNSFKKAYIPLTRTIKRDILPGIKEGGAHRLECKSISTHTEAHKWLEVMGAKCEGEHRGYGLNGENFKTYAWEL